MALQVMLYQVSVYCLSDIGLIRHNNEDACKVINEEQFYVLADGMGGHQAGEVASHEAVDRICTLFQKRIDSRLDITKVQELIRSIIQEVNGTVFRMSRENPELKGMGTTLCCIYLHPDGLIYGHVGDSRIYRFRKGELELLTQDHSLLQELIQLGQLSEQQAQEFLYKNIITKAIGTEPFVDPSVATSAIEPGDMLLMCSDGLSDLVSFAEIKEIMSQPVQEEISKALVEKAKQKGGNDNITVVLVKVQGKNPL